MFLVRYNRFPHSLATKGFTLIELAIVLVIIGLIVGGVLVGRDLIRAAEVRAQVSQMEKYNQAMNAFKEKYNCLPGDCPNATSFFGSFPGWGVSSNNGNGDEMIRDSYYSVGNPYPYNISAEPPVVFSHLFLAGFADCCNPSNLSVFGSMPPAGRVYPASKLGNGGFMAMNIDGRNGWWLGLGNSVPASPCGGGNNNDYMNLQAGATACVLAGGLLTPPQAQAMDAKIDDSYPTTGNMYAAWVYGGDNLVHPVGVYSVGYNCIANTTPPSYNLSSGAAACSPFLKMQ